MIKVASTVAAVIFTCTIFTSCKKKDTTDTSTIASANKGRLVCMADNNEWISDAPNKLYKVKVADSFFSYVQDIYGTSAYTFGDTLYVSGVKVAGSDSSALDFVVVLKTDRIGTYTIGNYPPNKSGTAAACFYHKLGNKTLSSTYSSYNTSGTFELTGFNDSLKFFSGKFHFDMNPKISGTPHQVKNGVFQEAKLD